MTSPPLDTSKTSQDGATPEAGCKYGREDQGCQEDAHRQRKGEHSVDLGRTFQHNCLRSGWTIWPTCFNTIVLRSGWSIYLTHLTKSIDRAKKNLNKVNLWVPSCLNISQFSSTQYSTTFSPPAWIFLNCQVLNIQQHFPLLPKYFSILKYSIFQVFFTPASWWGKWALWPSTCTKLRVKSNWKNSFVFSQNRQYVIIWNVSWPPPPSRSWFQEEATRESKQQDWRAGWTWRQKKIEERRVWKKKNRPRNSLISPLQLSILISSNHYGGMHLKFVIEWWKQNGTQGYQTDPG